MASTLLRTYPVVHVCAPPPPFYLTTTARVWNVEPASLITSQLQLFCCLWSVDMVVSLHVATCAQVLSGLNLNWSLFSNV